MPGRLDFNFSVSFKGVIWNMLAAPDKSLLLFEVRDELKRQVSFSAYQYSERTFLWKDQKVDEPWWVSLLAVSDSIVLLQRYDNADNPDRKTIMALNIETRRIEWKREDFRINDVRNGRITGFAGTDEPVEVELELTTGEVRPSSSAGVNPDENGDFLRPFQYLEGTPYFETVKEFLQSRQDVLPVAAAEYLEYNKMIFISYNIREDEGLANYLLVLSERGEILMNEKLGERLKGLGRDTFFVLSGCLFYVRNRNELLSYQIV